MHAAVRLLAARYAARSAPAPRRVHRLVRLQSTYAAPATGVNAAYDEALKIIEAYNKQKAAEADAKAAELAKAREAGAGGEALRALETAWFDLAVESKINDGEVLWNARQGNYDLSQPVYQHLKQHAWRGRPLEVLMQRLLQMYVLPDMLDPRFVGTPEAQLNVVLGDGSGAAIEPGSIIDPASAREEPRIELVSFNDEPRLHTLLIADLDEPCEETRSFREQFHWAVANLPLSKTQTAADTSSGTVLLPYIPPHPAHGTPAHRYVVAVFEQRDGGQARIDAAAAAPRDTSVRDFVAEHGLHPVGLSFFRAAWNESVDAVYRDVLGQPAPRFGLAEAPRANIGPDGRPVSSYASQ
ncbi:mitochondrial 54S ribosomal protein YmL35 [Coemansia biformis]|uniref:Mitochondrial 54S ribosomal protein YmL35 n=1 Tax=Coemansia biformis TaxID=1286918 RepID=A0A9W7YIS0_9FUNG|nr:mitochondrial 54S ribosomal protein YmL35 [Coemansia biformis]